MQPECAGKRVREDDPKEGEVPADDDDAAASAAASASAQDDPDAEAGKILTASEGLEVDLKQCPFHRPRMRSISTS